MNLDKPLWRCPECGAKLVSKNLWHSCGEATLDDWKRHMGPRAQSFFQGIERLIANCGDYHIAPAKTRIAFMGRVRFAGITNLSETGMTFSFALPAPVDSNRFTRVEKVADDWWIHWLRVDDTDQLDAEIGAWLCESYRLMGMQERLK